MSNAQAKDKPKNTQVQAIEDLQTLSAEKEGDAPPAPQEAGPAEDAGPSQADLLELVASLKARLDKVENRQETAYPDDASLFIAKERGRTWEERVIDPATKSYVNVQRQETAFYGPFASQEAVSAYLSAKFKKRADANVEWEGVRTVTGREKRQIEAQERAVLEESTPRRGGYFRT